jgi:hypothetical protein
MSEDLKVGERVKIRIDSKDPKSENWFEGTVIRIDPYSEHRSFYWVEFDDDIKALLGISQISIFNPKNIKRV